MVFLFVAEHEVQPGQPERIMLVFPGSRDQATAYVSQYWPGAWSAAKIPVESPTPLVLCRQTPEKLDEAVATVDEATPAATADEQEVLFAPDLDAEGVWD
jgi:hypothetical protein